MRNWMKWNPETRSWSVYFSCMNLIFESKVYRTAYFFVKYELDLDRQFIVDYINNR